MATPSPSLPQDITVVPELTEPPKRKWLSWLKMPGWKLTNPGRYDEFSKEALEITSTQDYFDGMKFDFTRALSDSFLVHHTLQMGSADANGGGTYSFAPSVASKNKKTNIAGRFDGEGRVLGRLIHLPTPNLVLQSTAQVSAEQSSMNLDASYAGSDWTGSMKLESGNIVELTMMQGVLPQVGLGLQMFHIPQPHMSITGMSAAVRVWGGGEVLKPATLQRVPRWVFGANSGSSSPLHATFALHTPYKADFATELVFQPRQDGGLDSIWCVGALYEFNSGRVKARFDSSWRLGVMIEESVSPNIRAYLCGDMDHWQNKYKLGFGITMQS